LSCKAYSMRQHTLSYAADTTSCARVHRTHPAEHSTHVAYHSTADNSCSRGAAVLLR
jgi:hypothetical protein